MVMTSHFTLNFFVIFVCIWVLPAILGFPERIFVPGSNIQVMIGIKGLPKLETAVSHIFWNFHPDPWVNNPNLTSIFFKWVETTT